MGQIRFSPLAPEVVVTVLRSARLFSDRDTFGWLKVVLAFLGSQDRDQAVPEFQRLMPLVGAQGVTHGVATLMFLSAEVIPNCGKATKLRRVIQNAFDQLWTESRDGILRLWPTVTLDITITARKDRVGIEMRTPPSSGRDERFQVELRREAGTPGLILEFALTGHDASMRAFTGRMLSALAFGAAPRPPFAPPTEEVVYLKLTDDAPLEAVRLEAALGMTAEFLTA